PAPARGLLTGFEVRADGIWGKVDWNAAGRALMAEKAYRRVSPAILYSDDARKRVLAITCVSLVNKPNLRGLEALNQENDMNLLAQLAKKLGLADGASEEAVIAAVDGLQGAQKTALQAQLDPIARAAGLNDGATAEAV